MMTPMTVIPFILQRWISPCNMVTSLFFIIPPCIKSSSDWNTSSLVLLAVICSLILYSIYDSTGTFATFLVHFSLLQVSCLRQYLDFTVQQIMANPKRALSYFRYYRQIQILSRYYNLIQQDILVNTNLGMIMSGIILSAYALLTIGIHNISFAELVMFATVVHDGVLLLLLYTTFMSKLFETSMGFVGKINYGVLSRMVLQTKKRKLVEKTMRSFKPMKSYLGYANYVDKSTPFVMFDFCFTQLVNLLLIN